MKNIKYMGHLPPDSVYDIIALIMTFYNLYRTVRMSVPVLGNGRAFMIFKLKKIYLKF